MSDKETHIAIPGFGLPETVPDDQFRMITDGGVAVVTGECIHLGDDSWTWSVKGRAGLTRERALQEMHAAINGAFVIEQRDPRGHLVADRRKP